jgi:hypothetical protein
MNPFTPAATTAATLGASQAISLGGGQPQVIISVGGTTPAVAFAKFGSSAVTASASDFPILPNTQICLTAPSSATHIAIFGTAGTAWVSVGHGVLG